MLLKMVKTLSCLIVEIGNEFRPNDLTLVDVTAVVIFLWAWYHQHVTTVILADIRKDSKGSPFTVVIFFF
jgi:hypothetical protein